METYLESLSNGGTALYNGQIFDESGQCILRFSQLNFNQIEMNGRGLKPKI